MAHPDYLYGFMAVAVCAQSCLGISPAWSRNPGWAHRDTEEVYAEVYAEVLGDAGCKNSPYIKLFFSHFKKFIIKV